jgi:hypothetical protein
MHGDGIVRLFDRHAQSNINACTNKVAAVERKVRSVEPVQTLIKQPK